MRGYGPTPSQKRCFDIPASTPVRDDAARLGELQTDLRLAQNTQRVLADELSRATERVNRLQNEVDALREAILG